MTGVSVTRFREGLEAIIHRGGAPALVWTLLCAQYRDRGARGEAKNVPKTWFDPIHATVCVRKSLGEALLPSGQREEGG